MMWVVKFKIKGSRSRKLGGFNSFAEASELANHVLTASDRYDKYRLFSCARLTKISIYKVGN